jgi:N-formylglutamate deformylase
MQPPVTVVHIPHASQLVPVDCRSAILLDDPSLAEELRLMTDTYTDELFALDGSAPVRFPISRLVVDAERFTDDAHEPMAARGMGVLYTTRANGQPLREPPSPTERARLLEAWYHPHHDRLTLAVDHAIAGHGRCIVLDAHSFPSRPLPYELHQNPDRPQICLGTDPFHTPPALLELATAAFTRAGFSVRVNEPFSGALVPAKHYQRDPRVVALMVEVRRDLYMHEDTGARRSDFASFGRRLQALLQELVLQTHITLFGADPGHD